VRLALHAEVDEDADRRQPAVAAVGNHRAHRGPERRVTWVTATRPAARRHDQAQPHRRVPRPSLAAILAVHVITDEHSSGTIRTTLAATPHRTTVLAAQSRHPTGIVSRRDHRRLGSLMAGGSSCPAEVSRPSAATRLCPWPTGTTLRAAVGSVLYLALIAFCSVSGIATVVRNAATSIGIVLGLLLPLPDHRPGNRNQHWQRLLQRIGP